jgi:ketosteroid isomerase-like protein
MSAENMELVRRGIADVYVFWDLLDEHVVWDLRGNPLVDLEPVYQGREAVIAGSRHYWGTWDEYSLEAEEVIDRGATVVVAIRERMRGKGSGVRIDRRWAQTWTFQRGRVIRWEVFRDKEEAMAAVG